MPNTGQLPVIEEEMGEDQQVPPTMIIRDKKDLYNTAQVETYVEVKVIYYEAKDGKQGLTKTKRTNVDEGSMPKWNEVLQFPLESEGTEGF